jgi:hypothetical protein
MPLPRGLFISLALIFLGAIAGCDETLYHASETREKTWDVGHSPEIVAELRGGRIDVRPGQAGKVTARLSVARVSKTSQQVADDAVSKAPGVSLTQEKDLIRIMEEDGNNLVNCSLVLFVPAGTRLNLRTGLGDVWIGYNPRDGQSDPVALAKLTIRTDLYIGINIINNLPEWPDLDLEGINLTLIVNGAQVDVGHLADRQLPGGKHHWRFSPK